MKKLDDHTKALIAVLLAVVAGGGNAVFTKIALREIPPFSSIFLRWFIAFLFVLPLFLREKPKIDKDFGYAFAVSTFATINIVMFAFGVRLTSASVSQMIYAGVPMIIAILSYFMLKEKVTRQKVIGLIVGLAGVAIIIFSPLLHGGLDLRASVIGNFLIFISTISFSLYTIFSKKLQKKHSPVYVLATYIINSMIVGLVFGLFDFVTSPGWYLHISMITVWSILYTGIFGAFLFYLLYQYAIKHGTPVIASMSLYLLPIAAFIWASILLGEKLTPGFILGSILAFAGAYLVTKKPAPTAYS
ncbi:hypothetical protein A3G67_02190 [Candidatus Roizmanbacteria bacterium RIFCSPLOWO2_12_FULL_40_12]|uniref:EamA domain-containing protein n=1 Tax=Candidatus Roizmanbacteria bacterium RIFCSPLOWO2_01_FULL_40_42 TaxID=1802066 RepID=A0A1F7J3S6_9BACT|nr:MAG: hypothetical protein A2779_01395 [Candidatus Roizmanbacteria bacterium RIFCSPHIGHO2_01_FULL_40_98]OGK29014.1 MAG: hypothetical protein A3C31_02035 [Candidatus Roizmanbacteria bacterium RIFCSPHIGHO2_02_FULL_40_53]OGK29989.1 MAG: hypothetical protein A2W49_00175 [Candidatus Roizmanbacteria bacterium RIFCSPHIGHO2_12_41_18]OGK37302.1 MAG: hypothetical protein A3E69_04335 [Candidatus Roizmanbacteria bacterium RIFCSPHIGHO2_12_FULL_40_130]OGK50244.1 MAG: hypothetical protein A3B50_00490 [Candi